jgi:hypothetical protein
MKLPKMAILMLRGVEGCGVSTYARHFKAFFDENQATCDIFALNLSVGRPDTSTDINLTLFDFSEAAELVNAINLNYDLVLVFSVPAKNAPEQVVNNYVSDIIEPIRVPKWMINHDHHFLSINRNADYINAIEACDGLLCHSLTKTKSGFISWLERKGISKSVNKMDVFFHVPFVENLIDLDRGQERQKRLINAARAVAWKRGSVVLNFHNSLATRGFVTEMIGFERSIAGYSQLKNYEGKLDWFTTNDFYKLVKGPSAFSSAKINNELFDFVDEEGQNPDLMYVFGSYDYKRGLKRISQSAFATHPRSFEHNNLDYGNNFEYQGLEAALLSVPIFHRHFLDTVVLPDGSATLAQTGVFLSIDDDNRHLSKGGPQVLEPHALVEKLDHIWNDMSEYHRMRKNSVDLIRAYYSSDVVVPRLLGALS